MAKKHLSPEGLRPCVAEVRACKYPHVNEDGSFSPETSREEMETIVNHLATAAMVSSDKADLDAYFNAKTTLEKEKAGSVHQDTAFVEDISQGSTLSDRLDPNNPDPALVQALRDRAANQDTSEHLLRRELAILGRNPELHDLRDEMITAIPNTRQLQMVQDAVGIPDTPETAGLGSDYRMVRAFFDAPQADEYTRRPLLRTPGLTSDQVAELASETKTGWMMLASSVKVPFKERDGAEYQALVARADAQFEAAEDDSLSMVTVGSYLMQPGVHKNGSRLSAETILRKTSLTGSAWLYSSTVGKLAELGVESSNLSVESKLKTIELAQAVRGDGDSLGNPQEFLNRVKDTWGGISLPPQEKTVAERELVKARKRAARFFASQADRASALADEIYYTSEVRTQLWERIEKAVRAQG